MIIEITDLPDGKNPQWVRQAWVGLKLPCLSDVPVKSRVLEIDDRSSRSDWPGLLRNMLFGRTGRYVERHGYQVSAKAAVGILSLSNEDAAVWWIDNARAQINQDVPLLFETRCCRLL